jgi:hypothetical protein
MDDPKGMAGGRGRGPSRPEYAGRAAPALFPYLSAQRDVETFGEDPVHGQPAIGAIREAEVVEKEQALSATFGRDRT